MSALWLACATLALVAPVTGLQPPSGWPTLRAAPAPPMKADDGSAAIVSAATAAAPPAPSPQATGSTDGAIEPFQFRVRGTPAAAHEDGRPLAARRPPSLHTFTWAFSQTARLLTLDSAEGEWSNWTAFTSADLKAAAARDTRTSGLPYLILSLDGTWVGASGVPELFSLAMVEVEFAPDASGAGAAASAAPPVATVQVSATLGFSARVKTCKAQCGTLGLLVSKTSASVSVQTFREFNNATYYSTMAASSLAPSARPQLFPLIDRLITDSDVDNERLGLAAMSGLGYTGMASSHANGPQTKAVYRKVGLQWTSDGMHIPLFAFEQSEVSNISADAVALVADGLLSAGFAASDYKLVKISDEPGWYYPSVGPHTISRCL